MQKPRGMLLQPVIGNLTYKVVNSVDPHNETHIIYGKSGFPIPFSLYPIQYKDESVQDQIILLSPDRRHVLSAPVGPCIMNPTRIKSFKLLPNEKNTEADLIE
ncbi:unnamed protein product [Sphenostylis stenocarpa]|uniref:Uncharacterized protein n=1 Tax=Sphenostylis stenocarpa TaxID=92480 RepID=A0AA86RYC1_9FABA|nr:unnamed protein product [Sphenostylis stenocarpa]